MSKEYQPRKFKENVKQVIVDNKVVPSLVNNENFTMTVASFQDHGRPCFVGSAIKSNPTFLELARGLTADESKKANERFTVEIEKILDRDQARRIATLTAKGKPDIHIISIGESFDPKSLRLYYTRGVFNNAPAVYQLAISRLKDAKRVERVLEEVGYSGTKNWEKRKIH